VRAYNVFCHAADIHSMITHRICICVYIHINQRRISYDSNVLCPSVMAYEMHISCHIYTHYADNGYIVNVQAHCDLACSAL
jgi:hypothetical protein